MGTSKVTDEAVLQALKRPRRNLAELQPQKEQQEKQQKQQQQQQQDEGKIQMEGGEIATS